MIRALTEPSIEIKRFRANPWAAQRTFETPKKELQRFVKTFLAPFSLERAVLETAQVVFEPDNLLKLADKYSIRVHNQWELKLEAVELFSVSELLEAALGDCVDFAFVLAPAAFAIYADHDQYITFYAPDEPPLAAVSSSLLAAGFVSEPQYIRPSHGNIWR